MTTLNQKDMAQLLRLVRAAKYEESSLSVEELNDLECKLNVEEYVQQLDDFKTHMDKVMPDAEASDETWNDFYELDWQITFAGKTVTLHNEAEIYNVVDDLIDKIR